MRIPFRLPWEYIRLNSTNCQHYFLTGPKLTLYIGGEETSNVFQLLGYKEDNISAAIAWALANCGKFFTRFISTLTGAEIDYSAAKIFIHRYEPLKGITDIEIIVDNRIHILIEAKRGWQLPGLDQLKKYATRDSFVENDAERKLIVTLSEASQKYANVHMLTKEIGQIRIKHLSWKEIVEIADRSIMDAGHIEKRLLSELKGYLMMNMHVQRKDSNWVYVVSLSTATPKGWNVSWTDIVRKHYRYFHPISGSWPKEPPTYIAFRYYGQLQSIHYIQDYSVIENLKVACPGIPDEPTTPHYLYVLGEAIVPSNPVKTGNIYPSGRVWASIDTLLTCRTISDARDRTKIRMNAV